MRQRIRTASQAFSPDGRILAAGYYDGIVLRDVTSPGRPRLPGGRAAVTCGRGHPGIIARARIAPLLASQGMAAMALAVSRMRPALTWRAVDGDRVAGEVSARLRPDNRCFVYFARRYGGNVELIRRQPGRSAR